MRGRKRLKKWHKTPEVEFDARRNAYWFRRKWHAPKMREKGHKWQAYRRKIIKWRINSYPIPGFRIPESPIGCIPLKNPEETECPS